MGKENEMRLVTRQETFNDFAVRELAKGRSACICCIQFGRCKKSECASCQIHAEYENCYNQMNDYDRARLANYVSEYWREDSLWPDKWTSHKGYVWRIVKFTMGSTALVVVFALVVFALILLVAEGLPFDQPTSRIAAYSVQSAPSGYKMTMDDRIKETLVVSQRNVRDFNKDGRVNCIDYSCSFKHEWDLMWPEFKKNCQLVRNQNPDNGMHHLFARVYGSDLRGGEVDVEPWARSPYLYEMRWNWNAGYYNPKRNIYGETNLWMRRCGF